MISTITCTNRLPHRSSLISCLVSIVAVVLLSGCPVNSTAVSDTDLIAEILVQNDNGQTSATVAFGSSDLAGYTAVDLVAGESISYQQSGFENRRGTELRKTGDGEYVVSLPSDAAGWYSFTLLRLSGDREAYDRKISDNHVYLPGSFQAVQAEPVQSGSVMTVNWSVEDSTPMSIDGFLTTGSEETFNASGSCQNQGDEFDVAITEGLLMQQNAMWLLEIPVIEHLQQVAGLPADAVTAVRCNFDVQLVRSVAGSTDIALNSKSSASGRVLKNVPILWTAQ